MTNGRSCVTVKLLRQNRQEDQPFVMNKITQDMQFRQSLLIYASKYGVTKAAIRYKVNRQYVYRWQRRYDGTWESLKDRSHRPKSHPNQHTDAELKLIRDMRRRNPHTGLVVFSCHLSAVPCFANMPWEQGFFSLVKSVRWFHSLYLQGTF